MQNIDLSNLAQYLPLLQGQVRPVPKPTFKSQPIFKKELLIGKQTDDFRRYTQIKFWIHAPTQQYPEATCFLSFINGRGSVYTKISRDDIRSVSTFLTELLSESESIYNQAKLAESQVQQVAMTANSQTADAIAALFGNNGEPND